MPSPIESRLAKLEERLSRPVQPKIHLKGWSLPGYPDAPETPPPDSLVIELVPLEQSAVYLAAVAAAGPREGADPTQGADPIGKIMAALRGR